MKHTRSQNNSSKTKIALYAGASLLTALAAPARADIAGDALINKLEQKGILSADEAKELRVENQQDYNGSFTNSFDKSFAGMTGMPDWVTSYKFSGDFRGRYDYLGSDDTVDRGRFRYRLRAGVVVSMKDNLQAGFRLGSGDYPGATANTTTGKVTSTGGSPLSNNTTLQDDFSKKAIYLDAAYGMWTPVNDGTWMLSTTIGKMDNPFHFTPMVFDPDLTPEGGALQGKYTINARNNITFAGAAFVLDEISGSTHDPFMYGGQVSWNSKWNDKLASTIGVGGFQIGSAAELTTANVSSYNLGNTLAASGAPAYKFNPVIGDASVTYTLDSFPLYDGKFPVTLSGEFINNPAAPKDNNGCWVGMMLGKSGKKHTWDVSYRYEYLERDAWYAQVVDDDNAALFASSATSGTISGGTNIKGHLIKADYSLTDALTLGFTCYMNDLISSPYSDTSAIHAMADVMWKF